MCRLVVMVLLVCMTILLLTKEIKQKTNNVCQALTFAFIEERRFASFIAFTSTEYVDFACRQSIHNKLWVERYYLYSRFGKGTCYSPSATRTHSHIHTAFEKVSRENVILFVLCGIVEMFAQYEVRSLLVFHRKSFNSTAIRIDVINEQYDFDVIALYSCW